MRRHKRQNAKLGKVNFYETTLQFYEASFKKLKYWLGVYYFVLFGSIFVIPLDDWALLFSSNRVKRNMATVDRINMLLKDRSPDSTKVMDLKDVSKDLIKSMLEFPSYDKTPFLFDPEAEGEYFRNRRIYLESKSKGLHGFIVSSLVKYFEHDSLRIIKIIDAYRRRYEFDLSKDPSTYKESQNSRWYHAVELRSQMVAEINRVLDSLYVAYLQDPIGFEQFKQFGDFDFDKKDMEKTLVAFEKENRSKLDRLRSLEHTRVGKIPYIDTQLTFKFLIILIGLFFLFSPFLLQFLHLNFKIYEAEAQKYNFPLFRVQSLKNIFSNLGLTGTLTKSLQGVSLTTILFLIPYLGVLINFYLIFNILSLKLRWIILLVYLICFFVVWKLEIKKSKNARFFAMHFK
jgi:hypothetical protein